jgi:Cft2 family RNA processing exonuclease
MHLPYKGIKIALDHGRGDYSFISHAHADHLNGIKKQNKYIASEETYALAGLEGNLVSVEGAKLISAGHILGARQLVLEHDGRKTVYTGDISVKPNIFGMAAEIPQCDRLIMESTYANPEYKFPDNFEIYESVSKWVKSNDRNNLLIGAYEMGKAQEMVKVLNEYCGLAPVVTERAEEICKVYERFGIKLDRAAVGSEEAEELMERRFVAVVPMRHAKRYFATNLACAFGRETLVAVATGWALKYRFDTDVSFPLSDHADFNDLVHYAENTGAKEIEFFEGDGSRVVAALKNKIINPLLNK